MRLRSTHRRSLYFAIALGLVITIAGCGSKEPAAPAPTAAPSPTAEQPPAAPAPAAQTAAQPAGADGTAPASWTPEALEDLLAPIALYPDPVLSQVLIASTNPQEVLDAGNWLLENQSLSGKALDDAAAAIGFTPPIRALLQFPDTVDMMCRELGWTTELGEAFTADQAGVLDAVQRLRRQAKDVGNLQSSPQMVVDEQKQNGKEVIVLEPPPSQKVYVPQYDPVAVYAPAPAPTAAAAPAATTTTTTATTETKSGHSTGALITTGLLSFGAGILVNELFDDDDDKYKYYYPNYGYGGMPYYPPYPYRPAYGNGFYPGTGYRPPPGYGGGFYNSGNIIINNPGGGGNGYWDRYDKPRPGYQRPTPYKSPITAAKPNRPELAELQKRQPRPMPANVQRPVKGAEPANWKGKSTYAGAKGEYKGTKDKVAARPTTRDVPQPQARPAPKVQGSYKGAPVDKGARPQGGNMDRAMPRPAPQQMPKAKPTGTGDRGYAKPAARPQPMPKPAARPQQIDRPQKMDKAPAPRPANMPSTRPMPKSGGGQQPRNSAMSGADRSGKADRAASQRGKQSLPQGARSKGGGNKKNKR